LFASSEKSIVPNFAVDRLNEGFDVSGTECERLETARIVRVTGHVIVQMNTSRAVIMSGPVRGHSTVKLLDCNEFYVTIGVGDGSGAIALTNLPGERRVIESVDRWYSKGNWSKRPKVSLYGAH